MKKFTRDTEINTEPALTFTGRLLQHADELQRRAFASTDKLKTAGTKKQQAFNQEVINTYQLLRKARVELGEKITETTAKRNHHIINIFDNMIEPALNEILPEDGLDKELIESKLFEFLTSCSQEQDRFGPAAVITLIADLHLPDRILNHFFWSTQCENHTSLSLQAIIDIFLKKSSLPHKKRAPLASWNEDKTRDVQIVHNPLYALSSCSISSSLQKEKISHFFRQPFLNDLKAIHQHHQRIQVLKTEIHEKNSLSAEDFVDLHDENDMAEAIIHSGLWVTALLSRRHLNNDDKPVIVETLRKCIFLLFKNIMLAIENTEYLSLDNKTLLKHKLDLILNAASWLNGRENTIYFTNTFLATFSFFIAHNLVLFNKYPFKHIDKLIETLLISYLTYRLQHLFDGLTIPDELKIFIQGELKRQIMQWIPKKKSELFQNLNFNIFYLEQKHSSTTNALLSPRLTSIPKPTSHSSYSPRLISELETHLVTRHRDSKRKPLEFLTTRSSTSQERTDNELMGEFQSTTSTNTPQV